MSAIHPFKVTGLQRFSNVFDPSYACSCHVGEGCLSGVAMPPVELVGARHSENSVTYYTLPHRMIIATKSGENDTRQM